MNNCMNVHLYTCTCKVSLVKLIFDRALRVYSQKNYNKERDLDIYTALIMKKVFEVICKVIYVCRV